MILGSALVWFAIYIYYALHGEAKVAAVAFKSHLLASVELLLFILVSSMTRLNAMEERGISTLLVWQNKIMSFHKFFSFAVPCLVNFLLPCSRHAFFIPKRNTCCFHQRIGLRRESKRIILLFDMTLVITVSSNIVLELPPAAGMMAGLGLLPFFSFILPRHLTKTARKAESEFAHV